MNFVKIGDLILSEGYVKCLEILKTASDRTNKVNESRIGGEFEFIDGSKIIAIPANRKDDRDILVRSNTKYYIEKFLIESGIFAFTNEKILREKLDEFMDNHFEIY